MKQWVGLGLVPMMVMVSGHTLAEESQVDALTAEKYGYSYFTLGLENVSHRENHHGFESDLQVMSPVLNSGGLYYINDRFDFSIDALATVAPQSSDEEWHWAGKVTQTNKAEYVKGATNVQLHYKWHDHWRVVGGPSLTYQTYKRYATKSFSGDADKVLLGTWDETTTDLFLDVGVAYDSGTLYSDSDWKVHGKVTAGIPLWRSANNTQFPEQNFSSFGFRTGLEGSLSYRVMQGLSLGWFISMGYEKRFESDSETVNLSYCKTMVDGECTEVVHKKGSAVLPEADTWSMTTGLQAIWNF